MMTAPVSSHPALWTAVLAGAVAGGLFLLPRLSVIAPALALPFGLTGLMAALPILMVRVSGRFVHALLATIVAMAVILPGASIEGAVSFTILFGFWALAAGEGLARRRSLISAFVIGMALLSVEVLLGAAWEGGAQLEASLRSPQADAAMKQWAEQTAAAEGQTPVDIEQVRKGIVSLYPALSVISATFIVGLNIIGLARIIQRRRASAFAPGELLSLRWPLSLVAAFVGSALLLLAPEYQRVAWNGIAVTLFLFLIQGLSVWCFGLARLFQSDFMRLALTIAALMGPWALLLSLLGLFDQWFDFRARLTRAEASVEPPDGR
jgi:uncharacterized protein YybS (DUF2232 family)